MSFTGFFENNNFQFNNVCNGTYAAPINPSACFSKIREDFLKLYDKYPEFYILSDSWLGTSRDTIEQEITNMKVERKTGRKNTKFKKPKKRQEFWHNTNPRWKEIGDELITEETQKNYQYNKKNTSSSNSFRGVCVSCDNDEDNSTTKLKFCSIL